MNSSTKRGLIVVGVIAVALIPELAMAEIDVSLAVEKIEDDATDAISEIGVALLGLAGVALAFKWAKASIFG